jgi:hypothetical protein
MKFVADIGDRHGENRRQQQTLDETQRDDLVNALCGTNDGGGRDQQEQGDHDNAPPPQRIGDDAYDRRRDGDGERGGADSQADG